jgi:hypothetical protein
MSEMLNPLHLTHNWLFVRSWHSQQGGAYVRACDGETLKLVELISVDDDPVSPIVGIGAVGGGRAGKNGSSHFHHYGHNGGLVGTFLLKSNRFVRKCQKILAGSLGEIGWTVSMISCPCNR